MKRTMHFEMVDPTPEKWDLYDSIVPILDKAHGKIYRTKDRRKISRISNTLSVIYVAETEAEFFNIQFEAMKIIIKHGLDFVAIKQVHEFVQIEHTFTKAYQLIKAHQTKECWDYWIGMHQLADSFAGEYGVQAERVYYPERFAILYTSRFTSWEDFAVYCWECGVLCQKHNIHIETINEIPRMYQADMFDDILDLTDSKRVRSYA